MTYWHARNDTAKNYFCSVHQELLHYNLLLTIFVFILWRFLFRIELDLRNASCTPEYLIRCPFRAISNVQLPAEPPIPRYAPQNTQIRQ